MIVDVTPDGEAMRRIESYGSPEEALEAAGVKADYR